MHYLVYNLSRVQLPLLQPEQLDPTERAAYARRGLPYLTERTLLRRELARLSGIPAAEIRFSYGELGKPEFAAQPFNLSHSGELLCLAFHHSSVGVDLEQLRPRPQLPALAQRIMCPEQLEAWRSRGCEVEEFYACWCAAEALVKLSGSSIWQARAQPFVYREGRICPRFEDAPEIRLFEPAPGYAGAVAYRP